MEIELETQGPATIVKPKRRVDSATAKAFEEQIMKCLTSGDGPVLVDFAELEYISSAGLRVVLMAAKTAKAKARKFILSGMSSSIHEIFMVSGFLKILTVVDTRETALASL